MLQVVKVKTLTKPNKNGSPYEKKRLSNQQNNETA